MIIFPAIDLQNGKAVRLQQGKKEKSTIYADEPLDVAMKWQEKGAEWLHLIDLDGAFSGSSVNREMLKAISSHAKIPVQFGGGIRTLEDCEKLLDYGAARLIIGTVALEQPELFKEMCRRFPGKIGVSLDAENGRLKTRGWVKDSLKVIENAAPEMEAAGAAFIIYTDIARDGMHSGLNLAALARLLSLTQVPVIAAGGASTIEDIKNAWTISLSANLQGVVCGKALYDKTLDLEEGLEWLKNQPKGKEGKNI